MRRTTAATIGLLAFAACRTSAHDATPPAPAEGVLGADAGTPAPPAACAPGSLAASDGHCEAAGVPPSACGDGFAASPDGTRGCVAVLPGAPCPDGTFARPGETTCSEVGDCEDAAWNDLAAEAGVVYVDAASPGADADGGRAHPWPTIAAAIAHAPEGGTVAIAPGRYVEAVVVDRSLTLRGRCPRLVEIVQTSDASPVIDVRSDAFTLRDVSITATGDGLFDRASTTAVERVWIRQASTGLTFTDSGGAQTVAVSDSLIVANAGVTFEANGPWTAGLVGTVIHIVPLDGGTPATGILAYGLSPQPGSLHVDRTVVDGLPSTALLMTDAATSISNSLLRTSFTGALTTRASLTLRGVVVEGNPNVRAGTTVAGIWGDGTTVDLEATTVRDFAGNGVAVVSSSAPGALSARASRVERTTDCAVLAVGDMTLEAVSIDDTRGDDAPTGVCGMATSAPFDLRGVDVRGGSVGISVQDGDVSISGSRIAATHPDASAAYGDGIDVVSYAALARASISGTDVSSCPRAGLAVFGATASVAATTFADCGIAIDGEPNGGRSFDLVDDGDDTCTRAGVAQPCAVQSARLAPPSPVPAP